MRGYIMVTEAAATATATVTATSSATSPPTSSPIATIGGDKTTLEQTAESNIAYNGRPETAKTPIAQIVMGNGTN